MTTKYAVIIIALGISILVGLNIYDRVSKKVEGDRKAAKVAAGEAERATTLKADSAAETEILNRELAWLEGFTTSEFTNRRANEWKWDALGEVRGALAVIHEGRSSEFVIRDIRHDRESRITAFPPGPQINLANGGHFVEVDDYIAAISVEPVGDPR